MLVRIHDILMSAMDGITNNEVISNGQCVAGSIDSDKINKTQIPVKFTTIVNVMHKSDVQFSSNF